MFEINRSSIVVKPRQPFLDWARSLDDEGENLTLNDLTDDSTIYLIPEIWDDTEHQAVLRWCHAFVFAAELESWHTDKKAWPRKRNLKMFLEWFEVEFHSAVFDLCDEPIQIIDDDFQLLSGLETGH